MKIKSPTLFIDTKPGSFKITKETIGDDYVVVPYKKRKLFGWKRLTPNGFQTLYAAFTFLSVNYGDVFNDTNVDFE